MTLTHSLLPATALATLLSAGPILAQEDEGRTMRELLDDMMDSVNPWFSELGEMLGDLSGWHAPEVLPNGDILIRRRQPEEAEPEVEEPVPGEPFEL